MVNRTERGVAVSSPLPSPSMVNAKRKFFKHFHAIADREELISCYLCSMPQDGLRAGTLYLSANYICFYSKMLSKKIKVIINIAKVTSITQEKTAKIIPNAIRIITDTESYVFASFVSRNHVYKKLVKLWRNSETASDSGTSDLDALQQLLPEDTAAESGTVNFLLTDSEDVSSESSMPVAADATDGVNGCFRKSGGSPASTPRRQSLADMATVPACEPQDTADHQRVLPMGGAERQNNQEPPVAELSDWRKSAGRLWTSPASPTARHLLLRVASSSQHSIVLTITILLCLTSVLTMYRLAKLESSARVGVQPLAAQWHGESASSAFGTRSGRIVSAILDSNLQQLQEIKHGLDVLRTLLDRQEPVKTHHDVDGDEKQSMQTAGRSHSDSDSEPTNGCGDL